MRASREGLLVWLGTIVAVAGTLRLGFWQLDRAAQKSALIEQQAQRRDLPALAGAELARTPEAAEQQQHRRIVVRGRWLGPVLYLDNQPHDGRIGFIAVAPLLLGDRDAVLVQRGWSPRDPADRTRVAALLLEPGLVELQARIAPWPSRRLQLGAADTGPIRQNLDAAALQREWGVGLRPLSLLELRHNGTAADGWTRQWPAPVADVGKHQGYALQWFALAALIAGLAVWYRMLKPRRREDRR